MSLTGLLLCSAHLVFALESVLSRGFQTVYFHHSPQGQSSVGEQFATQQVLAFTSMPSKI